MSRPSPNQTIKSYIWPDLYSPKKGKLRTEGKEAEEGQWQGVRLRKVDHVPTADIKTSPPISSGPFELITQWERELGTQTQASAGEALLGPVTVNPIKHIRQ